MGFWMSSFAVQTEAWTPLNAHKVLHRLWSSLDLIFHLSRNRVAPQMCLRAPSSFPCLNHAHGWGSSFSSSQTLLHCHLLQEETFLFSQACQWQNDLESHFYPTLQCLPPTPPTCSGQEDRARHCFLLMLEVLPRFFLSPFVSPSCFLSS